MTDWRCSLFWIGAGQRQWGGDYATATAAVEAVPAIADVIAPEGGGRWVIELHERLSHLDPETVNHS